MRQHVHDESEVIECGRLGSIENFEKISSACGWRGFTYELSAGHKLLSLPKCLFFHQKFPETPKYRSPT